MDIQLNHTQVGREEETQSYAFPLELASGDTSNKSLDTAQFEAILLRLHSIIDVAGLWTAIQSILAVILPSDAIVLCLNARDFSSSGYIPRILATPRATKFLKWMRPPHDGQLVPTLISTKPGTKIYQMSEVSFDPRHLQHSDFFRCCMAPGRWQHIACLLFWDQTMLVSEIAILRTAQQGAVTDQQIRALQRIQPHIEATLRRLMALQKADRHHIHHKRERLASSARSSHRNFQDLTTITPADTLTAAEVQLIRLVHAGLSNKEIAARLHKSIRTVKTQLTSIYRKYEVRSRTRLLATIHGTAEPAQR